MLSHANSFLMPANIMASQLLLSGEALDKLQVYLKVLQSCRISGSELRNFCMMRHARTRPETSTEMPT